MKFIIFSVLAFNLFAYGEAFLPVCERTPQVKDAIIKKLKETIPTITCTLADNALGYIKYLDLESKGITLLKAGDFSGLVSLERIDLESNHLVALPAGLFSGLSSLKYLYLNRNKLSTLPAGLFAGLSSLEAIKLDNNNLSALPAGLFSELPFLKWLYLMPNPLPRSEKDRIKKEVPHDFILHF